MLAADCNDDLLISAELDRCAKDPWYFMTTYVMTMTTYVTTNSPTAPTGRAPMQARSHQRIAVERLIAERRLVINKARQVGVSTLLRRLALWGLMFGHKSLQGRSIVVIETLLKSRAFTDAIICQYNELPLWLRQTRTINWVQSAGANVLRAHSPGTTISQEGGDQSGEMILVRVNSHKILNGLPCYRPGMILVDEAAYGNSTVSDILIATRPTNDTLIAVTSTPTVNIGGGGAGEEFNSAVHVLRHRSEQQPVQTNSPIKFPESFTLAEMPWYVDSSKDETHLQMMRQSLGERDALVELFCEPPV